VQIMDALKTHPTATAIVVLIASYIGSFVVRLIQHRKKFKNLVGFSSPERQCRPSFEFHTAFHNIYTLITTTMVSLPLKTNSFSAWTTPSSDMGPPPCHGQIQANQTDTCASPYLSKLPKRRLQAASDLLCRPLASGYPYDGDP